MRNNPLPWLGANSMEDPREVDEGGKEASTPKGGGAHKNFRPASGPHTARIWTNIGSRMPPEPQHPEPSHRKGPVETIPSSNSELCEAGSDRMCWATTAPPLTLRTRCSPPPFGPLPCPKHPSNARTQYQTIPRSRALGKHDPQRPKQCERWLLNRKSSKMSNGNL